MITGAVFVDVSSAYETVSHQRLLSKVLEMTDDVHLTDLICIMPASRRFFVVMIHEREEEPLATTTKRTTTGKCTGTDVVQHQHQRPAHTRRHSQLHLRRRLVHRVARKDFNKIEASLMSAMNTTTTYYDTNQLRANHSKTHAGVCFPPKEPRSQTRTECSVERYQTLKHNNTSVSGHPPWPNPVL